MCKQYLVISLGDTEDEIYKAEDIKQEQLAESPTSEFIIDITDPKWPMVWEDGQWVDIDSVFTEQVEH